MACTQCSASVEVVARESRSSSVISICTYHKLQNLLTLHRHTQLLYADTTALEATMQPTEPSSHQELERSPTRSISEIACDSAAARLREAYRREGVHAALLPPRLSGARQRSRSDAVGLGARAQVEPHNHRHNHQARFS